MAAGDPVTFTLLSTEWFRVIGKGAGDKVVPSIDATPAAAILPIPPSSYGLWLIVFRGSQEIRPASDNCSAIRLKSEYSTFDGQSFLSQKRDPSFRRS